jgi:tetratricopeptide (TPR) repeat protein
LGLAACAWLLAGRVLLEQGRAEQQAGRPIQALELLRAARTMLPLDYQVADAARRALVLAGRPGEALAEGERALALAPDWPPGYAFLANLQERGLRDPEAALRILERGIARAPLDVVLLEQLARLRARHGDQESATDAYRRILAVEASPAGQVRALGEVRDWRFAMAHMQVGAAARRAGQAEEAHERDRDAACRFAERRVLVDRNPTPFIALGEGDPETEAEFRRYEEALWSRLAQDYAGRGENDLGRLCREQAAAAAESRRTLRERLVQPAPP